MGMKPKNIRIVIRKILKNWFESINDKDIREIAEQNSIVTGGCIPSMLLGEQVKDFDIYFRSQEAAFKIAKYYADEFKSTNGEPVEITVTSVHDRVKIVVKSAGVVSEESNELKYEYFETTDPEDKKANDYIEAVFTTENEKEEEKKQDKKKAKFRPVFLTANAITLSDKIQLVTRFFGEPNDIHKNYDFIHCTCFYSSWNGQLYLPHEALTSILSKELRYVGSLYPICSILRTRKFIERGWYITAGQILKCCWQISELNLSDPNVLEEQMTGVDFAYFREVIEAIKEKNESVIDAAYLFELLDKIF